MSRREAFLAVLIIVLGLFLFKLEKDGTRGTGGSETPDVEVHVQRPAAPAPFPPSFPGPPGPVVGVERRLLAHKNLRREVGADVWITVADDSGDLRVTAQGDSTLDATLNIHGPAKEEPGRSVSADLWRFEIVEKGPGRYRLSVAPPADAERVPAGVVTELLVRVPERARVTVEKAGGTARLSGTQRELELRGRMCAFETSDTTSALNAQGMECSLTVTDHTGPIEATASGGRVRLSDVTGEVKIGASFADTAVTDVTGMVGIQAQYGSVKAADIRGSCNAWTRRTSVTLREIVGKALVAASDRDVDLQGIRGPLTIEAARCRVRVRSSSGELSIINSQERILVEGHGGGALVAEGRFSPIVLRSCEGPARVQTYRAAVVVEKCRGEFHVKAREGDIHVYPSAAAASMVEASSSSGNMWVYLPEAAGVTLDAIARGGVIEGAYAGLPSPRLEAVKGRITYTMKGSLGDGTTRLTLATDSGDIRILKPQRLAVILKRYAAHDPG